MFRTVQPIKGARKAVCALPQACWEGYPVRLKKTTNGNANTGYQPTSGSGRDTVKYLKTHMPRPAWSCGKEKVKRMADSVGVSYYNAMDMIYQRRAPRFENCFWLWFMARKAEKQMRRADQPSRRDAWKRKYQDRKRELDRIRMSDPARRAKKNEQEKQWRKTNRDHLREWHRNMDRTRRATDPAYRANRAVRARLHKRLRAAHLKKHWRTCELLGCDNAQLKVHLESQFKPGMTWENHGTVWHIDHRLPLASFNLIDPEEQKRACHYTNLQPLWAFENMSKQDKIA